MTVVEDSIQDLDSIEDEDVLRRMLLQVDDFAEKKRIRARISKVKEKRLKEFYASDEITGSAEAASFSVSSRMQSETTVGFATNVSSAATLTSRSADSRKRSSQEHLDEIQVDEKMRKCEEIIAERIRKKSQERGKRLQQIKSEIERSENIAVSSVTSESHIEVSTDRPARSVEAINGVAKAVSAEKLEQAAEKLEKAGEELRPLGESLHFASEKFRKLEEKLEHATPRKQDRTEILTRPKSDIIQDPSVLGIAVEKEIEATEQTIESKKAFRCSPDTSIDRDSIEPPVRTSRYSPYSTNVTRKPTLDEIESVVLDGMEVIETAAETKKISPLMPDSEEPIPEPKMTEPVRKISSQNKVEKKQEPVRKSSLKETKKSLKEEPKTVEIPRKEMLLDLGFEPLVEDVSDATTPYLDAHKQSSEYLVTSPEPAKQNRRYSEVEIEDVTDSSFDEADLAEGAVGVVAEPPSKLTVIEEKPKKRSSSLKKKTNIPTASLDRAGSPGRRCCRRGTTPEAAPLTAAEKREKLIARKISVTDEEFERMEKEILEQEKQEKSKTAAQRKTKSPEKPEVEPKSKISKISPVEGGKQRSAVSAITNMLKPARRVDSKEKAVQEKPTEKTKSVTRQPDKTYTKKPSDERLATSPVKSPTKSRVVPTTKAVPKTTRGLYSPKSSKELPVALKPVKLDDETVENATTAPAKTDTDLNGKKKLQASVDSGSQPVGSKSGSADTPKNALSPVASRESTPKIDESSRKPKTKDESRRTSRDENGRKEYKRQDSGKINGERKNFDLIEDLELLERLLESAKEYDERSRIRARIRSLKKPVSGIPTLSTSSPRASPLLGRRIMPQVEKKATTPSPARKAEPVKKSETKETPKLKKEIKPEFNSTDEIIKTVAKDPEIVPETHNDALNDSDQSKPLIDHPYEKIPEEPVTTALPPSSLPVARRVSEIRHDETPLERTPSFRRSPSPVISSTAVIYRPQTVLPEPEPVPKTSPPPVRRKSAIKLEMKPDSTTVINEPVSTNHVTSSVIEVMPSDQLRSDNDPLSAVPKTPSEKPNKVARSLTSQLSFSGRLPENDPSQPQGPDETRVITSSYGIGPTDDSGKPLFGLGALRKARNKTPDIDPAPTPVTTSDKRDSSPLDSNGRPLFGLGALKAPRSSVDESSGNQVSRSVLDIIKSHEREGPLADRPDVIPERPRARKRDSFIQDEDQQIMEVKEVILERSPNLKGIIKQHEEVSRSFVDFKVDLSKPSGPSLVRDRSQPLSQVISQHEQAILDDKKIVEPIQTKIEIEKSLPISDAIRKHEQAIVEDKVISTSKTAVEVEKSLAVQEAVNLHKSAIEMDGKIFVPKRAVEVEKTQSIKEIIGIHKQKQEEEIPAPVDVKDVSSPRPRRKLRDTFISDPVSDPNSSASSVPPRRPGILKKPKESTVSQPDPVTEVSSQPDPYATLERVEIVRNTVSEKRVSIDNTVVVNGQNSVEATVEAAPWRRRSTSSSPSRAEPASVIIETSRVEVRTEVQQPSYEEVPSWRSNIAQRAEEPVRKPSTEPAWRRSEPEKVVEPLWRKTPSEQKITSEQSEPERTDNVPTWRKIVEPEPGKKPASEPTWRKKSQPELESKPVSEPAWRKPSEAEVQASQPTWRQSAAPVAEPEPENKPSEPSWRRSPDVSRKQSREPTIDQRPTNQESSWRSRVERKADSEPEKQLENVASWRVNTAGRQAISEVTIELPAPSLAPQPKISIDVRIPEPAIVIPETVVPAPVAFTEPVITTAVETAVKSSRYSREETRRFSMEQRFKEFGSSDSKAIEPEATPERELSPARSLTPAELRQASIAKPEHRNSVSERWQPKQPVSAAQSMTLDRTSRQTTPERSDNGIQKLTGRISGISSVKGLAQKFMQAVEDNGSPPTKQTKNYPKAGLIFRSSSFKQSQGLSPDQDGSPLRRTGSLRTEGSPSWRRASKENTDPNYDDSPPWRRKRSTESLNRDENPPTMRDFNSPAPKSFLEDHSKVTGVSDILDRMRAGNTVSGDDGPRNDEEARSLLNKFIGAQIILQGIEPVLQSSNGISQSNGHLQDSLISSQMTTKTEKQRQQRASIDTKIPSMGESSIVNGIDISTCDDHFKLNELLDSSNDYETRQKLKTRIRDLLAAEKQGTVTESNSTPALSVSHTSAFESTNQDLATPDGESLLPQLLINQLCTSLSQGALRVEDGDASAIVKENMFDSGTESGDEYRRKSQESLQQFMEGIKDSLERAGGQDDNLIAQVQTALGKLKHSLQGGNRHSVQELELVSLISRLQSTLNSVVREDNSDTPSRVLVEKPGLRGRFCHYPELKPVTSPDGRTSTQSITGEETRSNARTSDSDKENKLSTVAVPPDIEKAKSVPWKVRLAKRKTERAHTVNISPCNALDLRQSIRAAARNKAKQDIQKATGGQMAPSFEYELGRVGLLEAQASLEQEKQPFSLVKQKSIGDLYTPKPRPYASQKAPDSQSEDSDDCMVFYGIQKSSKSYGDIQNFLYRSEESRNGTDKKCVRIKDPSPTDQIPPLRKNVDKFQIPSQIPSKQKEDISEGDDLSRDGSIELIDAEDEPEEVVEVATLVLNVRDNDVRLEKRPERPGTLALSSNNNSSECRQQLPSASSVTSTDTDDEKNAVTAQLMIRGPLRRQEAVEVSLGDPSRVLFTESESVQLAIHKAAINKQLSREYRRDSSNQSGATTDDEEVFTGSLKLTKQSSKEEHKQIESKDTKPTLSKKNSTESYNQIQSDRSSLGVQSVPKSVVRDSSTESLSQKQGYKPCLPKQLSGEREDTSVISGHFAKSVSRDPSVDSLLQKNSSQSSVSRQLSSESILDSKPLWKQSSQDSSHDDRRKNPGSGPGSLQLRSNSLQKEDSNSSVISFVSDTEKLSSSVFTSDSDATIVGRVQPNRKPEILNQLPPDDMASVPTVLTDLKPQPVMLKSSSMLRIDQGIQRSKSSSSVVYKPSLLLESDDIETEPAEPKRVSESESNSAPRLTNEPPPVEESQDSSVAQYIQKQMPWSQVPRDSANHEELAKNTPAEKTTAKERSSRNERFKRRDSVKQQARRANTINIPKAFNTESVSPQRNETPAFVPKTENDRKFLAFICKNTTTPTVTPPTFTRAGCGRGVGGIWGSRFSNLKTAFESKTSAPVSPEPPKNRPRPEPKIDGLFVAQKVYDTPHQFGPAKQTSAPTTPVTQQRVEEFTRQKAGNVDVRNRYSVYSVNRVSASVSKVQVSSGRPVTDNASSETRQETPSVELSNEELRCWAQGGEQVQETKQDLKVCEKVIQPSAKPDVERCEVKPSKTEQQELISAVHSGSSPPVKRAILTDSVTKEDDHKTLVNAVELPNTAAVAKNSNSSPVQSDPKQNLAIPVSFPACVEATVLDVKGQEGQEAQNHEVKEPPVKVPEKSKQTLKVSNGEEYVAKAFVNVGNCEQVPKPFLGGAKNIQTSVPKQEMPGDSRNLGKPLITEHRKDAKPPLFLPSPTVAITPPWVKDIGRVDGGMSPKKSGILSPPAQKKLFEPTVAQNTRQKEQVPNGKPYQSSSDEIKPRHSDEPATKPTSNVGAKRDNEDVLALVRDLEANSMLIQGLIMSEQHVREAVVRDHVENSDRIAKMSQVNKSSQSLVSISKSSSDSSVRKTIEASPLISQPTPKPYKKVFENAEPQPPELPKRQVSVPSNEFPKPAAKLNSVSAPRSTAIERNSQDRGYQQAIIRQSPQRLRKNRPHSMRVSSVEGNGVTRTKYNIDREDQFDASSEDSSDDDASCGVPRRYSQAAHQSPTGLKSLSNIVHKFNDDNTQVVRTSSGGTFPVLRSGSQSSYLSEGIPSAYQPQRVSSTSNVAPQSPQKVTASSAGSPKVPSYQQSRVCTPSQPAPPLPPKTPVASQQQQKLDSYSVSQQSHIKPVPSISRSNETVPVQSAHIYQEKPMLTKQASLDSATNSHTKLSRESYNQQFYAQTKQAHQQYKPQAAAGSSQYQNVYTVPNSAVAVTPAVKNVPAAKILAPLNIPDKKITDTVTSPPVLSFAYSSAQAPRVEVPEFLEKETLVGLKPGLGFKRESTETIQRSTVHKTDDPKIEKAENFQVISKIKTEVQKPVPPPRRMHEEPKPLPRTVFSPAQKPEQPKQPQQQQPQHLQIPRSSSGSRVAALSSAIDGGLFKQQDSLSNRSPSPRRPQSLYAGDGPVVAAGKTSPRNSTGARSFPKQFEACISPETAEKKQEELIKFFFDSPNLLTKPESPKLATKSPYSPAPQRKVENATQRSSSGANLIASPSQRRIATQTTTKAQLRQRTQSDGPRPVAEPSDFEVSDIASDIDAVFDDLVKKEANGHPQGRTVSGYQKSVTASQSTNATMVQQNQGMIKKSTMSSSSFRSQSQTSTVTVNPGGSAFSKFQQLDRVNSASPKTPSSAVTGPAFSFGAPANKSGVFTVKDAILQWCQGRTRGYKNVQITDFSTSWTDGLAFCALIHHFYPDAFDFDSLDPKNRRYNLELAFRTADEKAGIAPLLDVEDMISMRKPDWKCVFTYIQTFYRRLKDE